LSAKKGAGSPLSNKYNETKKGNKTMKRQRGYALLLTLALATISLSTIILASTQNQKKIDYEEKEVTIRDSAETASRFFEANMRAISGVGWLPEGRITAEDIEAQNVTLPDVPEILGQKVVAYYASNPDETKKVDLLITTEGQPNRGLLDKYGWQSDYSHFVRKVADSEAIHLSVSGKPSGAVVGEIVNGRLEGRNGKTVDLTAFGNLVDDSRPRIGIYVEAPNQLVEWTLFFGDMDWSTYQPTVYGNKEDGDAWVRYTHSKPTFQNAGARLLCGKGLAKVSFEQETNGWVILPDDQRGLCLESYAGAVNEDLEAKTYFQFLTQGSGISSSTPAPLGTNPTLVGNKCHVVSANYGQKPLQAEVDCFDSDEARVFINPLLIQGLQASRIDSRVVAKNNGYGGVYDSSYESGTEFMQKRFMLDDYVTDDEFSDQCKKVIEITNVTDSGVQYVCDTHNGGGKSAFFSLMPSEYFFGFHCAKMDIYPVSVSGKIGVEVACESGLDAKQDFVIPSYIMVQSLASEISAGRYLYLYTVSGQMTTGTGVEGIRQSGYYVGKRGPSSKRVEISYDSGSGPAVMTLVVPFQYQ
jgi:hypothetical protein